MNVSNLLWQNLLELKLRLKTPARQSCIAINESSFAIAEATDLICDSAYLNGEQPWQLLLSKTPLTLSGFQSPHGIFNGRAFMLFREGISAELSNVLKHYIPLAVSRFIFSEESFLIAHAAQSLDGKMCTLNGASQWIGNEANLIHAHRIRALVDGIIVGARTMRNEHPKLSVRHVEGENPKRIVLCNSIEGFNQDDLVNTIVVCGERVPAKKTSANGYQGQVIQLPSNDQGKFSVADLRQRLNELGIRSLMLEGGPETVNQFIQQDGIDWLQLHIAPILFGSGKSIYECKKIECVAEAVTLYNTISTQMGDAVMLSGELLQGECNG
jgi:riboflavin-specific deaminase-like protein